MMIQALKRVKLRIGFLNRFDGSALVNRNNGSLSFIIIEIIFNFTAFLFIGRKTEKRPHISAGVVFMSHPIRLLS
jgi:hypothetical protein